MIELIKFELKKHYIKRSFILVLILFMLLNIFKINTVFNEKGLFSENKFLEYKDVYKECYEEFGGEITKDKIIKLMQIYNEIQAKIADRTLSTGYDKYSYTYNAYSDEIFFRWLFIDEWNMIIPIKNMRKR